MVEEVALLEQQGLDVNSRVHTSWLFSVLFLPLQRTLSHVCSDTYVLRGLGRLVTAQPPSDLGC